MDNYSPAVLKKIFRNEKIDVKRPADWFVRETRSRKVNNYRLKEGEDIRKVKTPTNCYEALDKSNPYREEWLKAINKEVGTIIEMGAFEDITPEEATKVRSFKSRVVFKVKSEPDGTIVFKARLVVKGFSQKYGIDDDETFAPTVTFGTILLILHIAATLSWFITGCDIGNAYLEALTNRELFMELPADYTGKDENGVQRRIIVRLLRNLYGSKQAAFMWYSLIYRVLLQFGFERSKYEPCCFIYKNQDEGEYAMVCICVDDLLIVSKTEKCTSNIKQYLAEIFRKIKDLKELEKYLGLRIQKKEKQIILIQSEYVDSILKEYKDTKNEEIQPRNTPLPKDLNPLVNEENGREKSIFDIIGKIRFLADRTRPDLAFAASFLARFAMKPAKVHVNAVQHVLGYILQTRDYGMVIGSDNGEIELFAMCDASFVRGDDSKGQLSYSLFLSRDSGAFFNNSQKDKSVSISSFHAEINALVEATKMIIYYREILEELGFKQEDATTIFVDNESVINIANSIYKDNKSMYLTNKINFIREKVNEKIIQVQYIKREKNIADIGTKSLNRQQNYLLTMQLLNGISKEVADVEDSATINSDN
jgi:hypothetical protein